MRPQLRRDTNTITIANFWENFLLGKYNFDPPYQRRSIWSEEKQSFFIDSILRNFPIPPIFLHQRIDDATGKTLYDVIDGKQRLTALVRFVKGEIPCSSERQEAGESEDAEIAGKYFSDLDSANLSDYKRHFWRYSMPIEYIDATTPSVIDNIFDRLNRNGEPLRGQELRNAKYHGTPLLRLVQEKAEGAFWKARLANTDLARMEHYEFISEAVFVVIEGGAQHANQQQLDVMYRKHTDNPFDEAEVSRKFDASTQFLEALNVDYEGFKLRGVSHLYGLWCFAYHCTERDVQVNDLSQRIATFYQMLRGKVEDPNVAEYSASMAQRTKEGFQRVRRLKALCQFTGVPL